MSRELKPCPRCGAKNSHAIYAYTEKVWTNDRAIYLRFIGIRCDDCGFSLDGYWSTDEAVIMWNAVKETSGASRAYERGYKQGKADAEPHWIPVTERLPEESGLYQVTDMHGSVVRYVFNANESSIEYWRRCAKAWMPLPEPYKGVTE